MNVDLWSWTCAQCGWNVISQLTVNPQQAVADALIRLHIQRHESQPAIVRVREASKGDGGKTMTNPEQDHADRRAAVWEARRWEAVVALASAWRSNSKVNQADAESDDIAQWALKDADALIAAARQKEQP